MSTRAETKRAYKEAEKQAGIYQVKNSVNGKVLLGGTMNLHGPLNRHRFTLKTGSHLNKGLQREWDEYGSLGRTNAKSRPRAFNRPSRTIALVALDHFPIGASAAPGSFGRRRPTSGGARREARSQRCVHPCSDGLL